MSNFDKIVGNNSEIKSTDSITHASNNFFTEIGPSLASAISYGKQ